MVGFEIPRHPGEHQSAIFFQTHRSTPFATTCAALAFGRATCRAGKASTTKEERRWKQMWAMKSLGILVVYVMFFVRGWCHYVLPIFLYRGLFHKPWNFGSHHQKRSWLFSLYRGLYILYYPIEDYNKPISQCKDPIIKQPFNWVIELFRVK